MGWISVIRGFPSELHCPVSRKRLGGDPGAVPQPGPHQATFLLKGLPEPTDSQHSRVCTSSGESPGEVIWLRLSHLSLILDSPEPLGSLFYLIKDTDLKVDKIEGFVWNANSSSQSCGDWLLRYIVPWGKAKVSHTITVNILLIMLMKTLIVKWYCLCFREEDQFG